MKHRALGTTGLSISEIGMGTIQITRLDWRASIEVVRGVMDLGVNWFDTAQGYFDSELRLGEAFEGVRDKVTIITKSGTRDPQQLAQHIEESLKRLRTDYIDVFFFHGAGAVEAECFLGDDGLLETAMKAIDAGKIRYLGFSAHRTDVAVKALDVDAFRVGMVPANFLTREYIDGEFMEKARQRDVAVVAMKPFGGGRVTNASVCLKFLKGYPDVIPCIGIEKVSEMAENIRVWDSAGGMTEHDKLEVARYRELLDTKFCRGCGYCMPCPEGISIPTVTFMNVFAKQMPRDKVVNESHTQAILKAEDCTECRQCVERCPYSLDIPEMLKDNIAFYRQFAGIV